MYITPASSELHNDVVLHKRQNATTTTALSPSASATTSTTPAAQQDQQNAKTWTYVIAAIIGVIVLIIVLIFSYTYIRKLKIAGRSPTYIPTKFLKRRWEAWTPKSKYANINRRGSDPDAAAVNLTTNRNEETTETSGVNRNTSIRSIMTLPAYSPRPKETEQVIGREGERAGIDTVVELPETAEEEEGRRENEMESLYQIRQARRREIAERDERRRLRREARENNDWTRLEELRRESRARREQTSLTNLSHNSNSQVNLTAEMLVAEHNSRGRERRISEVQYASIGQVRHDGTRIRSDSHDSERSGLLNGAAPMGAHNRQGSGATLLSLGGPPQPRYRDRSNSAATSVSTLNSSFDQVTPPSESNRPITARTGTSSHHSNGSISEISDEEVDIGSERLVISGTDSDDIPQPPEYDGHNWGDAPAYSEQERMSRANSRATTLTQTENLNRTTSAVSRTDTLSVITPSIQIQTPTAPNTPIAPSPVSPLESPAESHPRQQQNQ